MQIAELASSAQICREVVDVATSSLTVIKIHCVGAISYSRQTLYWSPELLMQQQQPQLTHVVAASCFIVFHGLRFFFSVVSTMQSISRAAGARNQNSPGKMRIDPGELNISGRSRVKVKHPVLDLRSQEKERRKGTFLHDVPKRWTRDDITGNLPLFM